MLLRLDIGSNGKTISLIFHIVLLAIAEAVDGEVGLQRVLGSKLIDASNVPSEALVAHLVVGAALDVFTAVWTVGDFVAIVEARIHGQTLIGGVGELLSDDVGAIACEEGGDGFLSFRVAAFLVFQAVVLIAFGTVVNE